MKNLKNLIKHAWLTGLLGIYSLQVLAGEKIPSPLKPVDWQRVNEIALLLEEKPAGLGDPCTNRAIWDKLLKSGKYDDFLSEMENFSFPPFSEPDYFSLSDGTASSSGRGLSMMRRRAAGLAQVTWAECLENKGRYTKMVEDGLRDILNQKSWVSPRVDRGFRNYKGLAYTIELTSSLYAHTIAQTLHLMGDKLSPGLRKDAKDALYKRIFNPLLSKIRSQKDDPEIDSGFLTATHNWNHVCLAGAVGAALAVIEDKYERALFAWAGEYYSQNGLAGFGEDGYCSEGIGYYSYGFGHFIVLRECILQATNGTLDLFRNQKVRDIAWYAPKIEILNGVYPAISDSQVGGKPDDGIMYYLSRNLGMGLEKYDTLTFEGRTYDNRRDVMLAFPNSASLSSLGSTAEKSSSSLRSFFEQTGVLIVRPHPDSSCRLGVAFKGGNNEENHNHNDVGSYTLVLGDEILAGDPGAIPYTNNIFNPEYRYTYKTVSSYGHPAPLVAGKQQQPGINARGVVTNKSFSECKDALTLDIRSAYDVPGLTHLERTMTYSRSGKGEVSFEDDFSFEQPDYFETAIITRAQWTKLNNSTLLLEGNKEKIQVTFSSPGNKLSIQQEEIAEGGCPYVRIRIYLDKPVKTGKIVISYKPVS
ncbi:MAG: hypothetical protein AB2L24_01745 [Mangrovibacterium sp.]